MFRKLCPAFLAMSLAMLPPLKAAEPSFSKLVIFSGSLSDTGNCASINCQAFPSPPFSNNRSTNGPDEVDVMASLLQLSSTPSLHLVGPEQGTNYAVFGALASDNRNIDLPAQVSAFLDPRGGIADPDALYFIFIGGNDVLAAVFESDDAAEHTLRDAAHGIEQAVKTLVAAGAKTLYVGNFIDIGIAPAFQDIGFGPLATYRSVRFNELLDHAMARTERSLDIRILKFDFFEFGKKYVGSASALGLTNTTDACFTGPVGTTYTKRENCDVNRFVFLTDQYPTARIHQLLGNQIVESLVEQLSEKKNSFHRDPWHEGRGSR
jgi:phospholipase/lecithinase/hemolysin